MLVVYVFDAIGLMSGGLVSGDLISGGFATG